MEKKSFSEKLKEGRFVITSEIGPPKGTNIEPHLKEADHIKEKVDAFNVTDLQSSVMRLGSLATCRLLVENGFEPIFQITCRDRNRLALQSDLLSASVLGIKNILCLTGDHTTLGDHPDAKPVFDLDAVSLLKVATDLMNGKDMKGNELDGKPEFFLGAVVSPGYDPVELQIIKMEKKIEAGARFFQTQAVYDLKIFEKFMQKIQKYNIPILGGIVLLKTAGMAKYMNEKVAGVSVPDKYIKMMADAKKEERPKVSIKIASELIKGMRGLCQGIHIMPLGWERYVPQVLEESGL
ncbi:MAG TPA: methylenetetrahydrofolate reductase [Candidatus Ratteibacteria bacterium]|jgi:5,10-methylenetetrahydrofolate reductase|uniref:Methylenetetrahydrofolate reductase n=1 Tax=candidate division TA06 bacterium ADurb.Bin131 TaxID=1852827 RepID=A0A1V6CDG2_UNCT6|nr:MAG: Bifunctional homocysteine S-methyltransferase/5,10-methylenetetrahydrofolate reductase [candidate division TA06 bacterium ADurb.Bin131]HOC02558.1 methylenetetrahydrofolate reductase [bacterium]HRS06145.1 methylenetetrahydrofolate reductase [Candidatus Ratteibacteria bacterium]HON05547.1 methylenetetrahydrofolate reductase [bacterium]HOQ81821.1 methylenetetrahydrofolate reductase [bacterium]